MNVVKTNGVIEVTFVDSNLVGIIYKSWNQNSGFKKKVVVHICCGCDCDISNNSTQRQHHLISMIKSPNSLFSMASICTQRQSEWRDRPRRQELQLWSPGVGPRLRTEASKIRCGKGSERTVQREQQPASGHGPGERCHQNLECLNGWELYLFFVCWWGCRVCWD